MLHLFVESKILRIFAPSNKTRNKMIKGYSFNLATRFGSDYKIPIAVYDNVESFEYELNLYEKDYGALTKWNELVKNVERYYNGDNEAFLLEYYNVRDKIITTTLDSGIYKQFITCKDPTDMIVDDAVLKYREKEHPTPTYSK